MEEVGARVPPSYFTYVMKLVINVKTFVNHLEVLYYLEMDGLLIFALIRAVAVVPVIYRF